jgi:hypothetical protein
MVTPSPKVYAINCLQLWHARCTTSPGSRAGVAPGAMIVFDYMKLGVSK